MMREGGVMSEIFSGREKFIFIEGCKRKKILLISKRMNRFFSEEDKIVINREIDFPP
jgi:hypothetical protein